MKREIAGVIGVKSVVSEDWKLHECVQYDVMLYE